MEKINFKDYWVNIEGNKDISNLKRAYDDKIIATYANINSLEGICSRVNNDVYLMGNYISSFDGYLKECNFLNMESNQLKNLKNCPKCTSLNVANNHKLEEISEDIPDKLEYLKISCCYNLKCFKKKIKVKCLDMNDSFIQNYKYLTLENIPDYDILKCWDINPLNIDEFTDDFQKALKLYNYDLSKVLKLDLKIKINK